MVIYTKNPKKTRLFRKEFLRSDVDPVLVNLNIRQPSSGEDLFLILNPNPEHKNQGGLTSKFANRLNACQASHGGWLAKGVNTLSWDKNDPWYRYKPEEESEITAHWGGEGKPPKYLAPHGVPTHLFFAHVSWKHWNAIALKYGVTTVDDSYRQYPVGVGFWKWVLDNPSIPIYLTEGEKKALCLLSHGYVAISTPGIWNARKIVKNDDGNKVTEEFLVPEFKQFCVDGRKVIFCFDNDVKEKTRNTVETAILKTGKLINKAAKCTVKVITIPRLKNDKGAVDDFIFLNTIEAFRPVDRTAKSFTRFCVDIEQKKWSRIIPSFVMNDADISITDVLDYIPMTASIVAIRSPKGTGKTKLLSRICQETEGGILAVGHRICLMRELCKRLGLDYRADIDKVNGKFFSDNRNEFTNRLGTCVESSLAIPDDEYTLIIDEVDQVLLHTCSSSTVNKQGIRPVIMGKLERLIQSAKRVIIASADVSDSDIELIKKLRKLGGVDDSHFLIENQYKVTGYPVDFIESNKPLPLISQVLNDAKNGRKLFITTDSKHSSKVIDRLVSQLKDVGLKVLVINAETSGGEYEQQFIQNINAEVLNWDIVITSPSMATGISIEINHFDKVYGLFYGMLSESDILQAMGRVRQPISRVLWVAKWGLFSTKQLRDSSSPYRIRQALLTGVEYEITAIRASLNPDYNPLRVDDITWKSNPWLDYWCQRKYQENLSKQNLRERVLALLEIEGNSIIYVSDDEFSREGLKQVGDSVKGVKQELEGERRESILTAEKITDAQAYQLETESYLLPKQVAELECHRIEKFYQAAATDELIDKDDKGKYRVKVTRFEYLQDDTLAAKKDVSQIDKQLSYEHGLFLPDFPSRAKESVVRQFIGLKDWIVPGKHYTESDLQPLRDTLEKYSKDVKSCLGVTVSDKQNSFWLFRYLCDQLGLKTQTKKRKNKVVEVWIDEQSYHWLTDLCERRRLERERVEQQIIPLEFREEPIAVADDGLRGSVIEYTTGGANPSLLFQSGEKVFVNLGFMGVKEGIILQIDLNNLSTPFNVLCNNIKRWVSMEAITEYCPL